MFCGQYLEAQQLFDAHLTSAADPVPEWKLKAWALRGIRGMLGRDEQKRQSKLATQLATVDAGMALEERKDRLKRAWDYDALSGLAWFNAGVLDAQVGERDQALVSFLMAALIQKNDIEAWCNAIGLGIFTDTYRFLVPDIIKAAYTLNGERLSAQMVKVAESQPEGLDVAKFLDAFHKMLASIPRKTESVSMRLLGDAGEYREIILRPPGS